MTTLGASLAVVVVCAGGCGATTRIHVSNPGIDSWPVPSSSEEVLTFNEGEAVDRNYRVIGKAFAFREKGQRFAGSTSEETLTAILREEAAARGADAIIGIYSNDIARDRRGGGWARYVSGLLVTFLNGQPERVKLPDFAVAVLPVLDQELALAQHSETGTRYAQYLLEQSGYYATIPEMQRPITPMELAAMTPEELENIGGWEVPLLLLVAIERTEERHRVIFSGADTFIHARLISRLLAVLDG